MFPELKKTIIEILEKAIVYIKNEKDFSELKELSNHTIHSASEYKDEDAIITSIIIYSLYKVCSGKKGIKKQEQEKVIAHLKVLIASLKKDNYKEYNKTIKQLTALIKKLDKEYSLYVGELFVKAKLVKGAMMFKHGLSLSYVSSLLNINKWDLMSYVGKTKYTEIKEDIPLSERVKFVNEYLS